MSAFGQAGFGSRNRQNQLRSQGQMDPYGQQVRQAMQPPTLNIYQAPQATSQAQTGGTAQPAPTATTTAQTGGMGQTKPVTPGTAQPVQPQGQGTQYGELQQRDWVGNTVSRMPPELAAQWQSMQSGQGGLGAENITAPDPNAERHFIMTGYGVGGDGVTMQPLYGPGGLGQEHLPRYRQMSDGTMQLVGSGPMTAQTGGVGQTAPASMQARTGGGLYVGPDGKLTPALTPTPLINPGPRPTSPGTAQPIQPQSQGTPYGDWGASMQGAWQQAAQDQELKRVGRDQLGMKPPTLSPGDMSISDWQAQRSGMDAAYLQQVRDEMARRGMQTPQTQLPVGMVIDQNGNWSPDWARLQQEQDDEMLRWLGGDHSAANPWS